MNYKPLTRALSVVNIISSNTYVNYFINCTFVSRIYNKELFCLPN